MSYSILNQASTASFVIIFCSLLIKCQNRLRLCNLSCFQNGLAVAQAVSRWLPTAAALFASGQHVGFVVDKTALGQVFSEYFCFPCQSSFHQFLHHHNHPALA
jgi:hypothetical protein